MKIVNTSFLQGENKYLFVSLSTEWRGRACVRHNCHVPWLAMCQELSCPCLQVSPGDTQPAQTAQGTLTSPPGFTVYLPTCNILTWLFANSKLKECLSLSILTAQWENTGCQEVIFNNFPVDVFQSEFWFWILTLAIKSWQSALVVNMIKENK